MSKVLEAILEALHFLNLTDKEGNLSITNMAVITSLIKMILAPHTTVIDIGAFIISVLSYMHKRQQSTKVMIENFKVSEFEDVTTRVQTLADQVKAFEQVQEAVAKQAEETKKLISQSHLANAFTPRK